MDSWHSLGEGEGEGKGVTGENGCATGDRDGDTGEDGRLLGEMGDLQRNTGKSGEGVDLRDPSSSSILNSSL